MNEIYKSSNVFIRDVAKLSKQFIKFRIRSLKRLLLVHNYYIISYFFQENLVFYLINYFK